MASTIEISAIDLKLLVVDVDRLGVGKFVHVSSPPHGIDSNFLCSKIVLDLLEPERSEYTFGLVFSALTDKQVASNKLSGNAYKAAQSTEEAYSNLQTEIYENYTSSAEFDAFKAEVEQNFQEIGDFNPKTYLTVLDAQAIYATIQALQSLEERVTALEQNEGGTE